MLLGKCLDGTIEDVSKTVRLETVEPRPLPGLPHPLDVSKMLAGPDDSTNVGRIFEVLVSREHFLGPVEKTKVSVVDKVRLPFLRIPTLLLVVHYLPELVHLLQRLGNQSILGIE